LAPPFGATACPRAAQSPASGSTAFPTAATEPRNVAKEFFRGIAPRFSRGAHPPPGAANRALAVRTGAHENPHRHLRSSLPEFAARARRTAADGGCAPQDHLQNFFPPFFTPCLPPARPA
jgi:hypothetical protein